MSRILDLPANCATEWITKPSSKTIAEVEGELSDKKLVTETMLIYELVSLTTHVSVGSVVV